MLKVCQVQIICQKMTNTKVSSIFSAKYLPNNCRKLTKILPKKCRKVEKSEFGFTCSQCIVLAEKWKSYASSTAFFFLSKVLRNLDAIRNSNVNTIQRDERAIIKTKRPFKKRPKKPKKDQRGKTKKAIRVVNAEGPYFYCHEECRVRVLH